MATVPSVLTVAVGVKNRAADYLTYIRDAFSFLLSPPRSFVYNSAAISATNSTWTLYTADTELYDTDSQHSTSSNTSRLVCNATGLYHVTGILVFNANTTGYRSLNVRKNAAGAIGSGTSLYVASEAAVNGGSTTLPVAFDAQLTSGDYIEMFGWQNSGGALNINAGGLGSCFFSMRWVANS
ncbi:MAG: hypothetical protein ACRCSL_06825 [Microbacterium sp.]